jgi:anaerobic ribonucleoside-triphosphate reductase
MKKSYIIIGVVVVVMLAAIGIYAVINSNSQSKKQLEENSTNIEGTTNTENSAKENKDENIQNNQISNESEENNMYSTGKHHAESEESQKLGIEIISELKEMATEFSDRYDLNYSVLATPAEGLSGRFTKMDRRKYGTILGVTDRDYYTNSNHVPVWYKCTAEQKARVEAPYHELTRGGHIFYIELDGDATHNPDSIEAVVDLMDKYNMGYGSVNHTRSRCLNCGFENADANLKVCPECGSTEIDTIQRITGYLVGTTSRWNNGKLAELRDRVTHIGGEDCGMKGAE